MKFESFEVSSKSATSVTPRSNLKGFLAQHESFDSFLLLSFPSVVNLPFFPPPLLLWLGVMYERGARTHLHVAVQRTGGMRPGFEVYGVFDQDILG